MNTIPHPSRPRFSTQAFSLVEVVLAVGIMALGVVTILGLLPHGLEMSRKTANDMAETRIFDQIVGEMQTMNWFAMGTINTQVRYFDEQGLELQNSSDPALSYVAQVTVPPLDVLLPSNVTLPGPNNNLRRVIIKLISVPLPNFNFDQPRPGVPVKVFTQLVANSSTAVAVP